MLATHQLQYLPRVDRIFVMEDGTVQASGTYQQVRRHVLTLGGHVSSRNRLPSRQLLDQGMDFVGLLNRGEEATADGNSAEDLPSSGVSAREDDDTCGDDGNNGRTTDDEERRTGAVEFRVYKQYMLGYGGVAGLLILLVLSLSFEVPSLVVVGGESAATHESI